MTTPTGQISLSDVQQELTGSTSGAVSMNSAAVRELAGKNTGAISMSDLKGKSRITITPSSSSTSTTNGSNNSSHTAAAPTGTATAYSWGVLTTIYGTASVLSGATSATASLRVTVDAELGYAQSVFYCDVTVAGVVNRKTITKSHVDSDSGLGPGGGPPIIP